MEIKDVTPEHLIQAASLLGAGIVWVTHSRAKLQREKIKLDLEILEKATTQFGENDERTKKVAAKATTLMSYIYRDIDPAPTRSISWEDIALAAVCFGGAISFFWNFFASPGIWSGIGAGITAFIGIGALLNGFGKGVSRKNA